MTAREVALAAALAAAERGIPLQDALGELLGESGLERRDRALASELALGALRRRLQLDLALSRAVNRPVSKAQPALAEAMRQGAHQVLFLDRVPARAAVNETVEIVKARMGRKPAAFANACLRALARAVRKKAAPRERVDDPRTALASRDGLFVLLTKRLLPDPGRDEAGWLAGAYGYPRWMVGRWLVRHGRARAERILEWGNAPPALCVRLNPRRDPARSSGWPLPADEAARVFRSCRSFLPGEVPGTYIVEADVAPAELPGLRAGLFSIQDETQARPVRVLTPLGPFAPLASSAPRAGEGAARVLDLCAGLGGKTMQLSEAVGPEGRVVAVDVNAAKLDKAREAAARLGFGNVEFVEGDALSPPGEAAGEFDRVLVDVPCSNLGALDRRPEVRFRVSEQSIARLAEREAALLAAGLARLAPGGVMVYSVCSFEEEETSAVVRRALGQAPEGAAGYRLEAEHLVLPEPRRRDGGYCARIAREL